MPEIQITDYDQAERAAWLRLSRTSRVGPITFYKLLQRFGSPSAALEAVPTLSARGKSGPLSPPSFESVDAERQKLGKLGGAFIFSCDQRYPDALRHSPDPPPVLTVLGDPALLTQDQVGLVGSRNASANGLRMATSLAAELGTRKVVVTSGLARGVDAAAHRAALGHGTVAVVAGGVDVIYPPDNEELYHQICSGKGAVVSEAPLGVKPIAQSFPKRNRIIAGLSLGTVVIEASKRSGSLITARLAGELGREVMAVPGSPLDSRSSGANHLLREGATLVTCADDVLESLRACVDLFAREDEAPAETLNPLPALDDVEVERLSAEIFDMLGPVPSDINDLIRTSGAPANWVQAALVELELCGQIERDGGHHVMRLD